MIKSQVMLTTGERYICTYSYSTIESLNGKVFFMTYSLNDTLLEVFNMEYVESIRKRND